MSNQVLCVVRIVNAAGKYEVIESADWEKIRVGKTASSMLLTNREVGSTWQVNIRLTDKESLKVESVEKYDSSATTIATVAAAAEPAPAQEPEPTNAPMVLNRDIAEWNPADYYISPRCRLAFGAAYAMLKRDAYKSVKLMMTGASGLGKTTIAQRFAKFVGFDCLRVNCATMLSTTDWFGQMLVTNDNGTPITTYVPSDFTAIAQRGNCVIILDEINRIPAEVHNSLFPLLDDDQVTNVYGLRIALGPNVLIVGTANIGYQYNGVFPLDEALVNRFDLTIEVEYLPAGIESSLLQSIHKVDIDTGDQIVLVAQALRAMGIVCSTRTTLLTARMVASGLTVRQAYEFAVILRLDDNETNARKSAVDAVNTLLSCAE